MPRKPKAIVLDSWSIIAYLEDEPSGQKIADLIADANEEEIPLCMSVVNAGEVWYIIAREISEEEANSSIKQLRAAHPAEGCGLGADPRSCSIQISAQDVLRRLLCRRAGQNDESRFGNRRQGIQGHRRRSSYILGLARKNKGHWLTGRHLSATIHIYENHCHRIP